MRQVLADPNAAYMQAFTAPMRARNALSVPRGGDLDGSGTTAAPYAPPTLTGVERNALAQHGGPTVEAANALASGEGWLRYANQGATRNLPLSDRMTRTLAQVLPELGIEVEVFSGGQPAKGSGRPRVGSTRHDEGNAADVFFYRNGRRLTWENPADIPILQEIVRRGKAAGLTGFGAGPGYMQPGSMHIGFGAPAVWGDEGRGANAPDWLRTAYYG